MKAYNVSQHAIRRAVERLEISEEHAKNHIIQLMQTAVYQGDTPCNGGVAKVFDHYKTRTRLIVGNNNTVITVYKFPYQTAFTDEIKRLVTRKLQKAEREYKRHIRVLEINSAELGVQVAQLRLNFAKAKSPKVRESINRKIDGINALINGVEQEVRQLAESFAKVKKDADIYCG